MSQFGLLSPRYGPDQSLVQRPAFIVFTASESLKIVRDLWK